MLASLLGRLSRIGKWSQFSPEWGIQAALSLLHPKLAFRKKELLSSKQLLEKKKKKVLDLILTVSQSESLLNQSWVCNTRIGSSLGVRTTWSRGWNGLHENHMHWVMSGRNWVFKGNSEHYYPRKDEWIPGKHKLHKLKSTLHSAASISPLSSHNTVLCMGSRKLLKGKTLWAKTFFNTERILWFSGLVQLSREKNICLSAD